MVLCFRESFSLLGVFRKSNPRIIYTCIVQLISLWIFPFSLIRLMEEDMILYHRYRVIGTHKLFEP